MHAEMSFAHPILPILLCLLPFPARSRGLHFLFPGSGPTVNLAHLCFASKRRDQVKLQHSPCTGRYGA